MPGGSRCAAPGDCRRVPSAFNGGFWNGIMARAYGVQAIPRSFLIGPDGRILRREVFPPMLIEEAGPGR